MDKYYKVCRGLNRYADVDTALKRELENIGFKSTHYVSGNVGKFSHLCKYDKPGKESVIEFNFCVGTVHFTNIDMVNVSLLKILYDCMVGYGFIRLKNKDNINNDDSVQYSLANDLKSIGFYEDIDSDIFDNYYYYDSYRTNNLPKLRLRGNTIYIENIDYFDIKLINVLYKYMLYNDYIKNE